MERCTCTPDPWPQTKQDLSALIQRYINNDMTTQAFWGHVMGTLLMPVTMDDLSAPNATVTGKACVLLEMLYKLKLRSPACLDSYSCCNDLLGILLHHPSRTAATRVRNKSRNVTTSNRRITTSHSMRHVEGRLDLHIQAGCGNGWLRHRHSPQAAARRGCYRGWRCHGACGRWRHWGPVALVI